MEKFSGLFDQKLNFSKFFLTDDLKFYSSYESSNSSVIEILPESLSFSVKR